MSIVILLHLEVFCGFHDKPYAMFECGYSQEGAADDDGVPEMGSLLSGVEQRGASEAHQGAESCSRAGTREANFPLLDNSSIYCSRFSHQLIADIKPAVTKVPSLKNIGQKLTTVERGDIEGAKKVRLLRLRAVQQTGHHHRASIRSTAIYVQPSHISLITTRGYRLRRLSIAAWNIHEAR